jgi:hypothetical protein
MAVDGQPEWDHFRRALGRFEIFSDFFSRIFYYTDRGSALFFTWY